ncbi:hypothetical protein GCM10010211_47740 [Streptomyces albospinus]|uniref:Lipoprotein n=1 Tax=Streptomyces albospinus TaxID=285515 RepID=A0ABQ2V9X1_9ACTN|nr:hypothetical protein [Streptomyces albospinus]GGU76199.1 hypothetical protein GCM10010211_47740 [Streptomyces albospinus]
MRRLITVPTVLLALTAAGCGTGEDGEGSTAASSTGGPGGSPGPQSSGGGTPDPASPPVPGQPVNCGELADALGRAHSVALFADPGAGGTVGCAEARDVMAEFFLRAPPSRANRGALAVRGWLCQYESGPTGTWITSCRKDKREMHTEEQDGGDGGPDGPPGASQLPSLPDGSSIPREQPSTTEL